MTYKIKENAKNVWIRNNENTQDLSPLTDANSVYFNNGRTLEQELGKGAMESNVVTIDSSMEKVIDEAYDGVYESCVFKGKTKWIDNDTQEILDDFVNGRNLSLIDCKMPVLTTYSMKNIFTGNINQGAINGNGTFVVNNISCYTDIIEVIPNTKYIISNNLNLPYDRFAFYDIDGNFMSRSDSYYSLNLYEFTVPDNTYFIRIAFYDNGKSIYVDSFTFLEVNVKDKSNILSTSEEIILREVGGVRDSYDALTGEYVQRIGEREYQEGDLDNSSVVTDLAKTQYILDKPVTTIVEPSTIPFIYQNGHIILESGYKGQSLLPTLEYTAMTNRTGQVENVAKTIQRHEAQLTLLEKMLITNIIELDYNNTLMALNLKMDEVK